MIIFHFNLTLVLAFHFEEVFWLKGLEWPSNDISRLDPFKDSINYPFWEKFFWSILSLKNPQVKKEKIIKDETIFFSGKFLSLFVFSLIEVFGRVSFFILPRITS